jgi:hypothetical protein
MAQNAQRDAAFTVLQGQLVTVASQAAAAAAAPAPVERPRMPEPRHPELFSGDAKDAEAAETWLFAMQEYLDLMGCGSDLRRILTAGSYLTGSAAAWYRAARTSAGDDAWATWDAFKLDLFANFRPVDAVATARNKLAALVQGQGSVRDYVAKFRSLCLRIPDVNEAEKLDRFVRGLAYKVKVEVTVRGASTFDTAVEMAERLDSLFRSLAPEDPRPAQQQAAPRNNAGRDNQRGNQRYQNQRGRPQQNQAPRQWPVAPPAAPAPAGNAAPMDVDPKPFDGECYNCGQRGHMSRNCPQPPRDPNAQGRRAPPRT